MGLQLKASTFAKGLKAISRFNVVDRPGEAVIVAQNGRESEETQQIAI
jgi:hypothetical protein